MKKAIMKTVSLLVLAVIIAGNFTGCGSDKGSATGSQESNTSSQASAATGEPVTLKVLTTRWGNMGDSFTKNKFIKDLNANANIKVEWQVESLNDWEVKKGVLLASGELPDVIIGSRTFNDSDVINNLKLFRQLDDLIGKYMPNYNAALKDVPVLKKTVTSLDGKMYSFGTTLPCRPKAKDQPVINKTWLDKLGLKEPTTVEELYNVLLAFKTKDPNGNGKADEIGQTGSGDINLADLTPFGITDYPEGGGTGMTITNNKLEYYPISDKYKEALKWLNRLYAAGIYDSEVFTQDDNKRIAKTQGADIARVGFQYSWTPDAAFGKWSDQYKTIAPLKGPDGKQYANGDHMGVFSIMRNEAFITANCKTPEVAAQWLDQFYTGEASIQNFWGGIGTVITKNSDGTYTLNDPPAGTSADAMYWDSSLRDFGPKYASADFQKKIRMNPKIGDGFKVEISKLADSYVVDPYPNVLYTPEENQELPTLTADINTYVKQMRAKFIIKGDIDAGWDEYVKKMKDMGVDKLIKIRTDAYTRYMNVK